jgi:hypothetical protein
MASSLSTQRTRLCCADAAAVLGAKRVLYKTALRLTVVQDMGSSPILDDECRKGKPADPEVLQKHKVLVEMILPMYPDRDVAVTHVVQYDVFTWRRGGTGRISRKSTSSVTSLCPALC